MAGVRKVRCLACSATGRKLGRPELCSKCNGLGFVVVARNVVDFPPASRATDPAPSHQAEEAVTASTKRQRAMAAAIRMAIEFPGSTSHELAARYVEFPGRPGWGMSQLEAHELLRRRLSDACHAGKLFRGDARKCRIKGRQMTTWWPRS